MANFERLKKTSEVLHSLAKGEQVPFNISGKINFYLGVWAKSGDCGTAACAVGSIAMHPWFNEQGLTLLKEFADSDHFVPIFEGEKEWLAVSKFYDIPLVDAAYLFDSYEYDEAELLRDITPEMVAQRIDKYVVAEKMHLSKED